MRFIRFRCMLAVLLLAGVPAGCTKESPSRVGSDARNQEAQGRVVSGERVPPCLDIDPRADEALRKMSQTLGEAHSFSFMAVALMDEPIETGQLAQSRRLIRAVVRRPDRVFIESHQGEDVWRFWHEGREVTLLDSTARTYAAAEVPRQIDEMLEDVVTKHGLTLPLSDLVVSNPYGVMTADARTGRYVGLHDVDGTQCHHLLFTHYAFDWQIWIEAAREPVPRKLVIDYKSAPGRPQFTALLSDWSFSPPADDEQFTPGIPGGAKKIEMTRLLAEATE